MDLEKVFEKCFLCPGLCISKCPIYSITRDRSTAPNIIGRSGYRLIKYGDIEIGRNLLECTGCMRCMRNCPIENPLPEAIRLGRRLIFGGDEYIGEKPSISLGDKLYIYTPREKDENIMEVIEGYGYKVEWINTLKDYIRYSMGIIERYIFNKPFLTDDIEMLTNYGDYIDSLSDIYRKLMEDVETNLNYILHIPCRLDRVKDEVSKLLEDVLGKPIKIIDECTGGGLLYPKYNLNYAKMILANNFKDIHNMVVTLCYHAREFLRDNGIESYTIIDLIGGV